MSQRGLRDGLASYVVKWFSNRPGKNVGFRVLYTGATILDAMLQAAIEGTQAAWPGMGTPTALPMIGQSRGLLQGESETNDAFSARLRAWLTTWSNAGSDQVLVAMIQHYLGNTPTVRIVNRAGHWVSIDPSGVLTSVTAAFDWDSVSNPERSGYWSDVWIVVNPAEWATYASTSDLNWMASGGRADRGGVGHNVPRLAVDTILSLVKQWKGAHTYVQAILWTTDPLQFVPGSSIPYPGTWGTWGRRTGQTRFPVRPTATAGGTIRYWTPERTP